MFLCKLDDDCLLGIELTLNDCGRRSLSDVDVKDSLAIYCDDLCFCKLSPSTCDATVVTNNTISECTIGYYSVTLVTNKLEMLHDVMKAGSCGLQFLFSGIIKISIIVSTLYSLL